MATRLELFCAMSLFAAISLVLNCWAGGSDLQSVDQHRSYGIVIHGGAGVIDPTGFERDPDLETAYREKLREALMAGLKTLEGNGSSVDAVEVAIRIMEDSPLFNAARGAVFTSAGTNEFDASIMNGKTLLAGGVGAITHVKNPISLARLVMEQSPHVLLVGKGAIGGHRWRRRCHRPRLTVQRGHAVHGEWHVPWVCLRQW
jgi:beta-aspartyl-peptidase (threonine type)